MIIENIVDKIKLLCWMIAVAVVAMELGWLCCHWRHGGIKNYKPMIVCAAAIFRGAK